MKDIIVNLVEYRDVGTLYLSAKFELDWSTNNGDLLSDRNHWTDRHTHRQTHRETESDTFHMYYSPYIYQI